MVKSRAEICRDYRRRLKLENNELYLRKERERRRKNYVPTGLLSASKKAERRLKVREAVQKYRQKQKREQENARQQNESMDTSGYETSSGSTSSQQENMIVAMQFPRRAAGPRKRLTNELASAKNEITKLRQENLDLMRRLKTEQRKRQRELK